MRRILVKDQQSKVLATVGDTEITEFDVKSYISQMDPQIAAQFQSEEGEKQILDELIRQELLYLDAKENKFDEEEEFINVLDQTKKNLLKSYAFAKTIEGHDVTEDEVKEFYKKVKDNLKVPATAHAAHILVEDEDEAKKIKEKIEAGEDFAALAQEHSSCPSKDNGGDLGQFYPGQMVPEFDEKVFSMEKGEISDPVKTDFGYHIIKLIDLTPERERTFDETKNELQNEVLRLKQQESYLGKIDELEKKYPVKKN